MNRRAFMRLPLAERQRILTKQAERAAPHYYAEREMEMADPYDSRNDTMRHICTVRGFLTEMSFRLGDRAEEHDASKMEDPEKSAFDEFTPQLKGLTYGSDEYRACLKQMKPAIEHHYAHNSHHPEHWGERGINGMDLLDLIEMLCDWKAATMRHTDGDMAKSLLHNAERFKIEPQLMEILTNTAERMGWIPPVIEKEAPMKQE